MSVYKHKKSPYWHFDFAIKGRRYYGSTGQTNRRAAEAYERRMRIEAAEGRLGEAAALTIDLAAGKWFAEVGKHRADVADVQRRLLRLARLIGTQVPLSEITMAKVSDAIQRRRGQAMRRSKKKGARSYLPSNATVNRDVIETLRPILRRAASHWGAKGLPAIAWKDLRLPEPAETVKTYTEAEQAAWLAECGPATGLALRLLLRYGLRFGELFFALDAFDPDGPRLLILKRKRDVPHVLPLTEADGRDIAARVGRAREAGLKHIWYVEVGKRVEALTYYMLQSRLNGAADRAGIAPGRRIHGTRHHVGTKVVRDTGNLRLAQRVLGHADIKSTMRYAHVFEDELRAVFAGQSRNSPDRESRKRSKGKPRND